MRRLYIDIQLEDGDTIESLSEQLDIEIDALISLNPGLKKIFSGEIVMDRARVQIKLSAMPCYHSSLLLSY